MAEMIEIELVYGTAQKQHLLTLTVESTVTVRQAVVQSGLDKVCSEIDLLSVPVGIFGKQVANPDERLVQSGDRIELYRPLLADPKEIRRLRAAKAKAKA